MPGNDQELIKNYLNGDVNALKELIGRYSNHIFNFIRQYVGDFEQSADLTQDTFVKVWKNIKKFDVQKSFKVWIFQIARNTAIDFLRKKKEIHFSDLENEEGDPIDFEDNAQDIEKIIEKKEVQEKIRKIFESLPENYKTTLLMYYQSELNFREISEIMGMPIDTIKSRHRRAILAIKKEIAKENAPKRR